MTARSTTARGAMSPTTIRRCGLAAVVVAVASIPLAPLNALARMQTESGASDLANEMAHWWAEPALRVLGPWLLDFSDPDTVYLTYGMFYAVAVTAVLACMVAARSLRPVPQGWAERWGWRLALAGYAVMLLGFLTFYWLRSATTPASWSCCSGWRSGSPATSCSASGCCAAGSGRGSPPG